MRKYFFLLFFLEINLLAQSPISLKDFHDGIHHWNLVNPERNYERFQEKEVLSIADNFIAWQNPDGGWPKNIDWLAKLDVDSVRVALKPKNRLSTLDNRNTFPQIAYLSEVYMQSKQEKYKNAALNGILYILAMQNASGGWRGWDVDAITFNDEITTGAMELFLDIKEKKPQYLWIDEQLYNQIVQSFDKALDVTLRCQIVVNGKKTAWCQQHDHITLAPIQARSFELPALTAGESCDILLLLMKIKNPSPEIVDAINCGMQWLESAKIEGIRVEKQSIPADKIINKEYPYDNVVVNDSTAPTIWARYYEIDTNRPFMCTRQGVKVYSLAEVDPERRTGYAWYGYWPAKAFKVYEKWKLTHK